MWGGGRLPRCTEISISSGDKGGQLEFFRGACATRQFGEVGVRFSLGPPENGRKKVGKNKENEGKSLEPGGKWRKRKKPLKWRTQMNGKLEKTKEN